MSRRWIAGIVLALALTSAARADAPANIGPPMPARLAPATTGSSLAHPSPPNLAPVPADADIDTVSPALAPAPENRKDAAIGSVTCFACPEGQDTYHGAICMNGIACAAEGITLQQLNIGIERNNTSITTALRKLEAARTEVSKMKGPARTKALQYINTALTELKTAGLKAGCKTR